MTIFIWARLKEIQLKDRFTSRMHPSFLFMPTKITSDFIRALSRLHSSQAEYSSVTNADEQ